MLPRSHLSSHSTKALAAFRELLRVGGVRAALQFLNSISRHRFTAVFRFEGDILRNLHLIDRENPKIERCPDLPVIESYCLFVRSAVKPFIVSESLEDDRVQGHPKQQMVRSYCGVPLLDENGELFGTICHFDFKPIPFTAEEAFLLDEIAPYLVRAIQDTEWRLAPEEKKPH
ncbi:GAF domain-containing protein [Leptolyngbya sp. FACHB-711]|uniref:GAF domain-containing protein n=1 Tax=Leptolyngbya sp. FACHB-711 TaxID=2692813 RepID=UPI001684D4D7|nr:GAF domain-containing protein [Leptolyngbya sp. FACHB-711]MBD2025259.1 GAF domain-containing protein [Leptolyngbya sp. FACHB-711]